MAVSLVVAKLEFGVRLPIRQSLALILSEKTLVGAKFQKKYKKTTREREREKREREREREGGGEGLERGERRRRRRRRRTRGRRK